MQQNGQEQQERKRLQPTAEQPEREGESAFRCHLNSVEQQLTQSSRRWKSAGPAAATQADS